VGLNEVKLFQTYLADYQINIVSKEHQNSIIFSGPEKDKIIYLFLHDNHYDVTTSMPAFLPENAIVIPVKRDMMKLLIIHALTRVNYVIFQIVRLFRGCLLHIVCVFLKVKNVSIDINKLYEMQSLYVLLW
jgi:hypothetical protein